MFFNLIVCCDSKHGIGKNNNIPWEFSKDIKHFKMLTLGNKLLEEKYNIIIMGNNTYKSMYSNIIPNCNRLLKKRINIILSKSINPTEKYNLENFDYVINNPIFFNNINFMLIYINIISSFTNECFIIGGGQIYNIFLDLKLINKIFLTKINDSTYNCDIIFNFNKYIKHFELIESSYFKDIDKNNETLNSLLYCIYSYKNKEENIFINTVHKILNKGVYTLDRSQVGTLSIFGKLFTYDIRNYRLPLFTHRKVFLKGIIQELLFFISGNTNTKILEKKGVNIWKGHTSREYLDSRGLTYLEEGDMGAGYGYQLRHFGAEYNNAHTNYTGKGFDQLEYVINEIKNNPTSRRILFSYWNPLDLDKTALAPCHILYQFNVNMETNELSCNFYQRSSDFCLAKNFNTCSAAILVFMLCNLCNLKPGRIIHNIGNIHIYMNQIKVVKEFIKNKPYNAPLLFINDPNNEIKKIEDFKYEHFKLLFYNSYKKYKIPMAI